MTVAHSAVVRNDIADLILAAIDAGVGAGKLVFRTSGDAEVATLTFSNPAGTVTGPTLTWDAITPDTNATGGTVAKATIEDDSATIVLTVSVTLSGGGGDIILTNLTVGPGDTVSVSSLTYTAPV